MRKNVLMILVLAFAGLPLASAPRQKGNPQIQKAEAQLNQAQQRLGEARKTLEKAGADAKKSAKSLEQATNRLADALVDAKLEQTKKIGIQPALTERDQTQADYQNRVSAITALLKNNTEYQIAASEAEKAGQELRKLNDDSTMPVDQKRLRQSELSAVIRRPVAIKESEMKNDVELQAISRRLQAAGEKAARLQNRLKAAIEADLEVQKARADVKKAQEGWDADRKAESAARADLSNAQKTVNREAAEVERLKQADQQQRRQAKKAQQNKNK